MFNNKFDCIYVVFGGESMEREGSIISACEVARSLDRMNIHNEMIEYRDDIITFLNKKNSMVFICMHGKNGEDGHMARLCEINNIPYTFSKADVHEFSFNKLMFKDFLNKCNVKTPELVSKSLEDKNTVLKQINESSCDRFILKPVFGGGSLGIKYFTKNDDYEKVIYPLNEKYQPYFIEGFVEGVFLTCVVSGDKTIDDKLEILEVDFDGTVYDYHKKHSNERRYVLPANISDSLTKNIKETSQKLYKEGGYSGIVRFDYIVNTEDYYCLEANTIPGLSAGSNAFAIWKNAGYSYEEMIEYILNSRIEARDVIMA